MDAKEFGVFIAQCRKQAKMTQSELAEKIHVTDKAVSRWERGIGFPDINSIEPLANALGISVLELMKSEKMDNNCYLEEEAIELMKSSAEVAMKNRKQESTATILAVFTTIVIAVLSWIAGFGNIGGSLFFGALVSVAEIGIYYYMDNREDVSGRKIYLIISVMAIVVVVLFLLHFLLVKLNG